MEPQIAKPGGRRFKSCPAQLEETRKRRFFVLPTVIISPSFCPTLPTGIDNGSGGYRKSSNRSQFQDLELAAPVAEFAEHLSLDRSGGKRHIPLWLTLPELGVVDLEQLERFFDIEQL